MELREFYQAMKERKYVEAGGELMEMFHKLSQEALQITAEINNSYHTPDEIRVLFSKLIGKDVDETFGLFPIFEFFCYV